MLLAARGHLALTLLLPAAPARADLTCSDLRDLSTLLLQKHIRIHMMTPEVRTRADTTYVERLDPQRLLYLAGERERLSTGATGVVLARAATAAGVGIAWVTVR